MTENATAAAQPVAGPERAETAQTAQTAAPPPAQPAAHSQHYVQSDPRQKSPFLAGLLSFMPGLGQIYTGYYQRGFVHAIVIATIITMLAEDVGGLTPLLAVFMAFFWLYNVIDAARRATLYNQALAGIGDVELPEDWKAPGFPGSIVGGLLIAAFGVVLLMETAWDMSLRWLEEYWPVGLIAFGLYLVWKAIDDRRKREKAASEID